MKDKSIPTWFITSAILVAFLFINSLFSKVNINLTNFNHRTIGVSILEGVDIAKRTNIYVGFITIFCTTFVGVIYLLKKITYKHYTYQNQELTNKEDQILTAISTTGIFLLIYHYINGSIVYVTSLEIAKILFICSLLWIIIKIYFEKVKDPFIKIVNNYNIFILSLALPIVPFFIRWELISGSFIFTNIYKYLYIILWFVYWFLLKTAYKIQKNKNRQQLIVSFLKSSIILLLIPAIAPILSEIQYSLIKHGIQIHTNQLVVFTLGIMFFIFLVIAISNKNTDHEWDYAGNLYLPILIITLTIFRFHQNTISINYFDFFHHGENLITTQQLFQFRSIPFINIFPTHGMSYALSQILYSMVNGYQQLYPWLWEWLNKVFEITLLYFVLRKVSNSFFAFIIIFLIPIIGIFGGQNFVYGFSKDIPTTYYFASFLTGLILCNIFDVLNLRRLILLWASCFFLLAWRIDFGVSSIISCILILLFTRIKNSGKILSIKNKLILILMSFLAVLIPIFLLFALLNFFGNKSPIITFIEIFRFATFQAQAQGLINVIASFSPISVFQYLLLPSVGIFYLLYFLYHKIFHNSYKFSDIKILLIFISIFSLIEFTRAFQRHTLAISGYNPYLFSFLLLAIPYFVANRKKEINNILFLLGILIYQLVLPNGSTIIKSENQITSVHDWSRNSERVSVNTEQYNKVVEFLYHNLTEDQTFIDLTSSPLLYVLTNKQFLNYLIPNAYHTSDLIQKIVISKINNQEIIKRVPYVIYRQPIEGANNIDSVPNEIRSYYIYEFIYKNYKPYMTVDGFEIWSNLNQDAKDNNIDNIEIKQNFSLKKIPYIWGKYDEDNVAINGIIMQTLLDKNSLLKTDGILHLKVDPTLDRSIGNHLHLKIRSEKPGILYINFPGSNSSIDFELIPSDNLDNDYVIRLNSLYEWGTNQIKDLQIHTTTEITVNSIYIRK